MERLDNPDCWRYCTGTSVHHVITMPARRSPLLFLACSMIAPLAVAAPPDRNPEIDSIVNAISARRIEATIQKLASFHTRHTLSQTESPTQGIGAARRWIRDELERCSQAAGGRLKVEFDSYQQPTDRRVPKPVEVVNVVATLPGTRPESRDRIYVVSGHYDSRASDILDTTGHAPGANDDASGTAAAMEMACVMAQHRFDATLVFMTVAGEEQGLLGAQHWAEEAVRGKRHIAGMITNDIIGSSVADDGHRDAKHVRLFASGLPSLITNTLGGARAIADLQPSARAALEGIARAGGEEDTPTHELGRYLKKAGERYLPGFTVNLIPRPDRFLRGGDHLPFLERGYAAVRFTEPNENYRHQHQDVRVEKGVQYGDLPEFVDFAYVADVARVNAAGLASLALAPAAPANAGIEVTELENDTTLRWDAGAEGDLAGYRIVWREPSSPVWQWERDVGKVTRATLPGISKDNFVFGVVAVDQDGNASPAAFPKPWRP
jgi:hypothetical protein